MPEGDNEIRSVCQRREAYFLVGLTITIAVIHLISQMRNWECEVTVASPRNVMDGSIRISGVWARNFDVDQTRRDTFSIYSNQLLAAACGEVISFDLETGEIIWRVDEIINPSDLTVDENNGSLYVSGLQEVSALSLSNGEPLWSNTSQMFSRTAVSTNLLVSGQLVVFPVGRGIYRLDKEQGELGEQIELPARTSFYDGNFIVTTNVDEISVVDAITHSQLWVRSDLSGFWTFDLIADDDLLVIRRFDSESNRGITVIRLSTGEPLWQWYKSHIVSNVVAGKGVLTFLTLDAKLMMLDIDSGLQLDFVQFMKPRDYKNSVDQALDNSQIVREDNQIGVYFQDENMLSVYEIGE